MLSTDFKVVRREDGSDGLFHLQPQTLTAVNDNEAVAKGPAIE
jgi:hypothetical protein